MESYLSKLSGDTESLAKDITNIVISMQFQDITRQRIEHVITPLLEFRTEIDDIAKSTGYLGDKIAEKVKNGNGKRLESMYTMESERKVLRDTLSNGDKKNAETL
jgi:methyl-accepting chemotaxis protein